MLEYLFPASEELILFVWLVLVWWNTLCVYLQWKGEKWWLIFRFPWGLWCTWMWITSYFNTVVILMIIFHEERVFTLWFWFEKDVLLHHKVLNQMLDLSAVLWLRSHWYAPLPSALPAHTLRRVLAAIYIWNIMEWVCISLSCLLTGHGGAEQKQHVRAAFSNRFSKQHLRIFAISRRLKNAHRRQGILCVSWSRRADLYFIEAGARAVVEQDCCSGAPAAFHLSIF